MFVSSLVIYSSLTLLFIITAVCLFLLFVSFRFKQSEQNLQVENNNNIIIINELESKLNSISTQNKCDGEEQEVSPPTDSHPKDTVSHTISNLEEVEKLKTLSAAQQTTIGELQQRLENSSEEEKVALADELSDELSKQVQFLQESETCIKLLEEELEQSKAEIARLSQLIDQSSSDLPSLDPEQGQEQEEYAAESEAESPEGQPDTQGMEATLEEFAVQSKEMLRSMASLEQENAYIRAELEKMQSDA